MADKYKSDIKMTKQAKKIEIRTTPCSLAVRENVREDGTTEESRVITGTAIVFNKESEVLDDWGGTFTETIKPEAVTMEFLNSQDIKLNLLHQRDMTIGRCNKGKGNMKLSVDSKGVHFEVEAPKCDLGDQALELVRAGVYSGCSFEFYPKDYEIKETRDANGKPMTHITHTAFESISALTIAMDPAYKQTSVSARELLEQTPEFKAEQQERENKRKREAEIARAEDFIRQSQINSLNY